MGFTDGLPSAQRRWAMLSYLVGLAMSVLDGNIANTALPNIATQLHASPAASIWVVKFHTATDVPREIAERYGVLIVCRKPMLSEQVVSRLAALVDGSHY